MPSRRAIGFQLMVEDFMLIGFVGPVRSSDPFSDVYSLAAECPDPQATTDPSFAQIVF